MIIYVCFFYGLLFFVYKIYESFSLRREKETSKMGLSLPYTRGTSPEHHWLKLPSSSSVTVPIPILFLAASLLLSYENIFTNKFKLEWSICFYGPELQSLSERVVIVPQLEFCHKTIWNLNKDFWGENFNNFYHYLLWECLKGKINMHIVLNIFN